MAKRGTYTDENEPNVSSMVQPEIRYTKQQLVAFRNFRGRVDLLNALLEHEKSYTMAEADQAIEQFMKGEVK